MSWKSSGPVSFNIDPEGINEVVEENGNMVTMLRKVGWGGKEEKIELRKWIVDTDSEKPMKGCAMTDIGWHNLTSILTKNGFGDTREIIENISTRDNFEDSLTKVIGKKKYSEAKETVIEEDDYFTPTKENLGL